MRRPSRYEEERYFRVAKAVEDDVATGRDFWASFYSVSGLTFFDDIQRFTEVVKFCGNGGWMLEHLEPRIEPKQPELWATAPDAPQATESTK